MAKKKASSQKQVAISRRSRLVFPQIFRFFSAKTFWRWVLVFCIIAILAFQINQFAQLLYSNYYEAQIRQQEKRNLEMELTKWEAIAASKPGFRDAYFQLAILSYRLGRLEQTGFYLNKVFELDPNFEPAREFEKVLNKKKNY